MAAYAILLPSEKTESRGLPNAFGGCAHLSIIIGGIHTNSFVRDLHLFIKIVGRGSDHPIFLSRLTSHRNSLYFMT